MEFIEVKISYPRTSGLVEDTQTNTMHFYSLTDSRAALTGFVKVALATLVQTWDALMDSNMFTSPATVDYYDMTDAEPRVPYDNQTIPLTLGSGTSLPLEVSMCASFTAALSSGAARARRRGRIYLPTFINAVCAESGSRVIFSSGNVAAIASAFTTFKNAIISAGTDSRWSIYSPTTFAETGDLQASSAAVANGWIDDEPDTQRRRGSSIKTRTTWA
jgi:hypothetical protein